MDCDTTGVEPDFALVKFKKLSGGGYFKIINQSVPQALKNLKYTPAEVDAIVNYAVGHASFEGAPHVNSAALLAKGFSQAEIDKLNGHSYLVRFQKPSTFQTKQAYLIFLIATC